MTIYTIGHSHTAVEVQHILHSGDLIQTRPDEFSPAPRQLGLF